MTPDIIADNQGTIWLLSPVTPAGKDWIKTHVDPDAQWFGRSLVVEHRYVDDILCGMAADGLEIA